MKAFQANLCLWKTQMHQLHFFQFPCCQVTLSQDSATVFSKQHFADKLRRFCIKFSRCFSESEAQEYNNSKLLCNPFAIYVDSALVRIQMNLIKLLYNRTLKSKVRLCGTRLVHSLRTWNNAPALFTCSSNSLFGSTHLCKQLFSVMTMNKTSHRSRLTDKHLQSIPRLSTTRNIALNINELVDKKRCYVYSSNQIALRKLEVLIYYFNLH